jgi:hypothetical protein
LRGKSFNIVWNDSFSSNPAKTYLVDNNYVNMIPGMKINWNFYVQPGQMNTYNWRGAKEKGPKSSIYKMGEIQKILEEDE